MAFPRSKPYCFKSHIIGSSYSPMLQAQVIPTQPYAGQRPGTSGLRKPTRTFMEGHYTHNFVQAILSSIEKEIANTPPQHCALVVGGDGRFFLKEAISIIFRLCAANGIRHIVVGKDGILSTPAVSHLIRKRETKLGGIVLTASHNPGGLDNDFGIKFNVGNGGPAPESVTEAIYAITQRLNQLHIVNDLNVDISKLGQQVFEIQLASGQKHDFRVEVVDSVDDYVQYMKEIFDFPLIHAMITGSDGKPAFQVLANAMNGVMGPYVRRVLCHELGVPITNAVKCDPLEDFGGGHPDPNLTYAEELVKQLQTHRNFDMGVAFDGDGDRNMVLGKAAFFVSPCDSVAALADNLTCIPYFQRTGVRGLARSMPTSGALDLVAKKHKVECYETPTGWKFFGNLMDANQLSLCGEESFGTGSDHIREKDGMWAVLAWLNVLASRRRAEGRLVSVEEIMRHHWDAYGRNYFTRYDYENCSAESGNAMMKHLEAFIVAPDTVGQEYSSGGKSYKIRLADNFCYTDPIDHSVSKNQGIRIIFTDGSRLIFRLSGTGSSGATIRVYVDSYEGDSKLVTGDSQEMLKPLIDIALRLSKLKEFTGRESPTVIT